MTDTEIRVIKDRIENLTDYITRCNRSKDLDKTLRSNKKDEHYDSEVTLAQNEIDMLKGKYPLVSISLLQDKLNIEKRKNTPNAIEIDKLQNEIDQIQKQLAADTAPAATSKSK